ncbi:MAG: hypothetical protein M3Y87_27380, partial [Myxococcota bacterium]|nr:hypothetical protein [Myxococcota bacterium]
MSMWKRVRALLGGDEPPPPRDEPVIAETAHEGTSGVTVVADPLDREAAKLIALAERSAPGSDDEEIAIDAFERLCDASREVLAIDLARRVLASAAMPLLRCRVAERLDARGDEATAHELLQRL